MRPITPSSWRTDADSDAHRNTDSDAGPIACQLMPIDNGKGVGRPALRWVQSVRRPIFCAEPSIARRSVSGKAPSRLSPPTSQLATTTENFVWSVAGDKAGNVYLGTGNFAQIFKIDAKGPGY